MAQNGKTGGFGWLLCALGALLSVAGLVWGLRNLHPDTETVEPVRNRAADVAARMDAYTASARADAFGADMFSGVVYLPPPHYVIPEESTVAPAPREACFGSVDADHAADVQAVIELAREYGLLDGQDVIFDPAVTFYKKAEIEYYCDETILVLCWKELIAGTVCSCVEVKVADASQFRRKIVNDTFGAPVKLFATSLSKSVNAVVAMNADFYMFRDVGIMAYQRRLYRFPEASYSGAYQKYNCIDTLFLDSGGNFRYFHRGETSSPEKMEQFLADNDILFSISFGPILIEDGELQSVASYPIGEVNRAYSRAGIGWAGDLHYFYMNVNHSEVSAADWTVNDFARHLYEKGLTEAYCLDGGQTGEIVFRGRPYNHVDFGEEREVSDIIYFATALPETEEGR